MGEIFSGYGYDRPGKTYSPAEEQFQQTWLQLDTPITLFREFRQDVRGVSSVRKYRYIDFAHPQTRIAVEIDGKDHLDRQDEDNEREWELEQLGWNIIRFTNKEVWNDPQSCALTTLQHIYAQQRMTSALVYQPQPFTLRPPYIPTRPPVRPQQRPFQRQQFAQPEHPAPHPRVFAFWWSILSGIGASALVAASLPLGPLPSGFFLCLIALLTGFLTRRVTSRIWATILIGLFTGTTYAATLSFTGFAHFAAIPILLAPLLALLGSRWHR